MLGRAWSPSRPAPKACRSTRSTWRPARRSTREIYLSLLLNRDKSRIAFVASAAGGMDIEEVAAQDAGEDHPRRHPPGHGPRRAPSRALAFGLGLKGAQIAQFEQIAHGLYKLYIEYDASLVEVNPLIVTGDGDLVALDAKIGIDDNALFRQPDLVAMRDPSQEDAIERDRRRARPQLRLARRRHRLHGERRGPRHGDDGHHQAATAASPRTSSTSAAAPRASASRRRSS